MPDSQLHLHCSKEWAASAPSLGNGFGWYTFLSIFSSTSPRPIRLSSYLEAIYDADYGTVAVFGNVLGLSHLRELIDDLVANGGEGSHYHLEDYSGLDGNVALILGKSSGPKPSGDSTRQ